MLYKKIPKKVLVTNDDGMNSFFMHTLIKALVDEGMEISIAAPATGQSWVGRAISKRNYVPVTPQEILGCKGWSIAGTPSDCVNIALKHLLKNKPDFVVAGINIGFNICMPMLLSSGTVAGALEGAYWGIPAFAFSHALPTEDRVDAITHTQGKVEGSELISLQNAARLAARFVAESRWYDNSKHEVRNYNFPCNTDLNTPVENTIPEVMRSFPLFAKHEEESYKFHLSPLANSDNLDNTDLRCLERGNISHTVLDYNQSLKN